MKRLTLLPLGLCLSWVCNVALGSSDLELSGFLDFAGEQRFSIYDKSSGSSFWLFEGQDRYGMRIEHWKSAESALTLNRSGRLITLKLRKEQITHLELRTREEILSDPEVAERNRKLSEAAEFMQLDASVGYQIRLEQRREAERAARKRTLRTGQ